MTARASGEIGNKTGTEECVHCFGRNGVVAQIKGHRLIAGKCDCCAAREVFPLFIAASEKTTHLIGMHEHTRRVCRSSRERLLFLFIVLRRNHSWRCPDSNSDSLQEFLRISGFIALDDRREIIVLPFPVQ